jgi:hypothetical protein
MLSPSPISHTLLGSRFASPTSMTTEQPPAPCPRGSRSPSVFAHPASVHGGKKFYKNVDRQRLQQGHRVPGVPLHRIASQVSRSTSWPGLPTPAAPGHGAPLWDVAEGSGVPSGMHECVFPGMHECGIRIAIHVRCKQQAPGKHRCAPLHIRT